MRTLILTFAMLAALSVTAAAAPIAPRAVEAATLLQTAQGRYDWQYERYCRRLERACRYKFERGEAGEGNCRRYRRECGGRRW